MGTITIQPIAGDEAAVSLVVTINMVLHDWEVQGFDQIQVWRSDSTANGPYYELTSDAWRPARVPRDAPDEPLVPVVGPQVLAAGTSLLLRLNDLEDVEVVLDGPDPITYADAAAEITAVGAGRFRAYVAQVATTGEILLVLEGVRPGTGATLEVLGGGVAALFNIPMELPNSLGMGQDARLNILNGVLTYRFVDQKGTQDSYYRTRLFNRSLGTAGEFSLPLRISGSQGISQAGIVIGHLDLVQVDGRPLVGRRVSVYSPTRGSLVENRLVTGQQDSKLTDRNGNVEFTLVRGVRYTVSIAGTDIVRDIVAPEDPTVKSFPLLGAAFGTVDDVFTVQVPNVVYAERRSI
jgi:hypothetical protein